METGKKRALELIAECKRTGAEFLDLGNLRLIEIPEEIEELNHLKRLNLGWYYHGENRRIYWGQTNQNILHKNDLTDISLLKYLPQLTSLDLVNNPNIDFSVLKDISRLTCLTLSNNEFKDISFFENLTELTQLYLASNNLIDISPLKHLIGLKTLDLSNNRLRDISSLKEFTQLTQLYLGGNQLTDISILKKLTQLSQLVVRSNQIYNLAPLSGLTELTYLDLRSNTLSDVSSLKSLTQLIQLNLSHNNLKDASILKDLTKLARLDINKNQITDISFLKDLHKLTQLSLDDNHISDVSVIKGFTQLTQLNLSNNQIDDISALVPIFSQFDRIESDKGYKIGRGILNLSNNSIQNPPTEVLKQGIEAVENYFQQIKEQGGTEPIYEARVLVVGEGKAGKTTLVKKLLNVHHPVPSEEDETIGIRIESHSFPFPKDKEITIQANIWDFGGQEIQYMTHQFFLTPDSLYVLVIDDREESTRLPYWFHTIQLLGSEEGIKGMEYSPVLVVLNKKKNVPTGINYDSQYYDQHFPNIKKKVWKVDFGKGAIEDLEAFNHTIERMIGQLPIVRREVPKKWKPIREQLIKEKTPYISLNQFREICSKNGVTKHFDQNVISSYLHKLGYIIHFHEEGTDFTLKSTIILEPKWALRAIYGLLLHESIKREDGVFTHRQMAEIWKDYSDYEQDFLLKLMFANNFDLVFRTDGRVRRYIAPIRLSKAKPKFDFENKDALRFQYDFKFMPEGIITRLIVREGDSIIKNKQGKRIVWQKGMLMKDEDTGCTVLVEEGLHPEQIINIEVIGPPRQRVLSLEKVRGGIDAILKSWFKNAKYDRLVPCVCSTCNQLSAYKKGQHVYNSLMEKLAKGVDSQCNVSYEMISPIKLLQGIETHQSGHFEHFTSFLGGRFDEKLERIDRELDDFRLENKQGQRHIKSKIDQQTAQILSFIPEVIRQELNETEKNILTQIYEELDRVRLDVSSVEELVKLVGTGANDAFTKVFTAQPTKQDILVAYQEMKKLEGQGEEVTIKDKFKLIIPLIPTILKYEREISASDLRKHWEWLKGGKFWEIFVEEKIKKKE